MHTVPSKHNSEHLLGSYFMVNRKPKEINQPKNLIMHCNSQMTTSKNMQVSMSLTIANISFFLLQLLYVLSHSSSFCSHSIIRKMKRKDRDNLPQLHFGVMDSVCRFNISLSGSTLSLSSTYE